MQIHTFNIVKKSSKAFLCNLISKVQGIFGMTSIFTFFIIYFEKYSKYELYLEKRATTTISLSKFYSTINSKNVIFYVREWLTFYFFFFLFS